MRHTWWILALLTTLGVFLVPVTTPAASDLVQGSPILTVLPVDAIPAIDNPTHVSVAEAERFMRPDEPVLGLSDGTTAKVYSAWQLNHHEIVNDTIGNRPVAVTW
ncbi:MAG: hypothetical protein A2Z31_01945 [candidate division NC10 bacterium RBG_16_65_8]|nr:MAG: hypothetical protein A2Z31_01945 [candidate division NC10 bacterium RBG_16_65_8]